MHASCELVATGKWSLRFCPSVVSIHSLNAFASPQAVYSFPLLIQNPVSRSFRNCRAQDLCPEESTLCPLNNLLVDGLWGVVHNDCAGLVVNLCVDTSVADEVDDPLLTLVLREAEAG